MGEVRIRIRLANAQDEAAARRGQMSWGAVRKVETDGVVDTGAVISTLPRELFEQLGLQSVGQVEGSIANDSTENVDLSEPVSIELEGRRTSEDMLVLGRDVLIGQTLLERLDLLVDCNGRRLISNPRHGHRRVLTVR